MSSTSNTSTPQIDLEALKVSHPELYAQIVRASEGSGSKRKEPERSPETREAKKARRLARKQAKEAEARRREVEEQEAEERREAEKRAEARKRAIEEQEAENRRVTERLEEEARRAEEARAVAEAARVVTERRRQAAAEAAEAERQRRREMETRQSQLPEEIKVKANRAKKAVKIGGAIRCVRCVKGGHECLPSEKSNNTCARCTSRKAKCEVYEETEGRTETQSETRPEAGPSRTPEERPFPRYHDGNNLLNPFPQGRGINQSEAGVQLAMGGVVPSEGPFNPRKISLYTSLMQTPTEAVQALTHSIRKNDGELRFLRYAIDDLTRTGRRLLRTVAKMEDLEQWDLEDRELWGKRDEMLQAEMVEDVAEQTRRRNPPSQDIDMGSPEPNFNILEETVGPDGADGADVEADGPEEEEQEEEEEEQEEDGPAGGEAEREKEDEEGDEEDGMAEDERAKGKGKGKEPESPPDEWETEDGELTQEEGENTE